MEIILNMALTATLVVLLMLAFNTFSQLEEELKSITESDTYKIIGGCFVILTTILWFIWVMALIWS